MKEETNKNKKQTKTNKKADLDLVLADPNKKTGRQLLCKQKQEPEPKKKRSLFLSTLN